MATEFRRSQGCGRSSRFPMEAGNASTRRRTRRRLCRLATPRRNRLHCLRANRRSRTDRRMGPHPQTAFWRRLRHGRRRLQAMSASSRWSPRVPDARRLFWKRPEGGIRFRVIRPAPRRDAPRLSAAHRHRMTSPANCPAEFICLTAPSCPPR